MKTKALLMIMKENNLLTILFITDSKYKIFEKEDFIKKRNLCEIFIKVITQTATIKLIILFLFFNKFLKFILIHKQVSNKKKNIFFIFFFVDGREGIPKGKKKKK
jgi:hypothetical protein